MKKLILLALLFSAIPAVSYAGSWAEYFNTKQIPPITLLNSDKNLVKLDNGTYAFRFHGIIQNQSNVKLNFINAEFAFIDQHGYPASVHNQLVAYIMEPSQLKEVYVEKIIIPVGGSELVDAQFNLRWS